MIFAHPHWLWLGVLLAPLVALEWLAARRAERAVQALVGDREGHRLLAQRRAGQRRLSALLRLAALALLIVGAAGPEWGREVVRRAATGSDIVFLIDVSASMDARDVPPSRLAEAQREALAVLDRLEGSRVGVVAFAGDAVRVCPLTLERSAVRLTLEGLTSGSVSVPGTDLGKGLRKALQVMPPGRRDEQAIILWTDGEDLEAGGRAAIDDVVKAGVRVFAVGCGTAAGDVVPVLDDQGRAVDVKRDAEGGPVRSRLDEALLRTLARRTRGGYFAASRPGGELPRLVGALGSVARAARGERLVERPVARFPLFAGLAVLLLLAEAVRARRRLETVLPSGDRAAGRGPGAGVRAAALLGCVALGTAFHPHAAAAQSAWAKGDRAFRAGHYAEAESLYARRLRHGGPDAVRLNLATARAMAGSGRAEAPLADLARTDDRTGRTAGYNLGTVLGEKNEFEPALRELRRALVRDPTDADARFNYELLLRRQREARRRQQQNRNRPQNPQDQQKQQKPQQGPSQPAPNAPQPQGAPQQSPQAKPPQAPPPPGSGQGMDRAQAERLLGALEDLQRLERQRHQKVRVMQEKRGKDW